MLCYVELKGIIMLTKQQINVLINADIMSKYGLNISGLAMLLAQCHHESQGFTKVEENLNYSADRLLQVFPKYFNKDNVNDYARNPEAIANKVYCNRMGNGDENSGDGYLYRGRGNLQLTGKNNYRLCGSGMGLDLIDNPQLLCQPQYAMESALWFFKRNLLINNLDIEKVTKRINGGLNGLAEREKLFNEYKKVL